MVDNPPWHGELSSTKVSLYPKKRRDEMLYSRNIRFKLLEALEDNPVTLVVGAHQTGKTTLMKEIAKEKGYHFVTFDDIDYLASARNNPKSFIAEIPKPVIFDEIRRVPELFLPIKMELDSNRIPGQYLLTGSANPLLLPGMRDSMAGRMEMLEMYPLSQGEINNTFDNFIDIIWQHDSIAGLRCLKYSRKELFDLVMVGGYPLVQAQPQKKRDKWFKSYIKLILQKDILDLSQIEHIDSIPKLLRLIAARAGSLVNISELSRSLKIPATTVHRYITFLETLFIVLSLESWSSNFSTRVIKSSKVYMVDSGLLAQLLGVTAERALEEPDLMGSIMENFVVTELKKQASWSDTEVKLYYFRTTSGVEVDIVLERPDGKIIGIEVKTSGSVQPRDITGLKYLRDSVGDKWHRGIVLYTGSDSIPLDTKITALPMSALWSFIGQP